MKLMTIILQIFIIHLFLFLGAGVKHFVPVPIPASMFGLILLFLALLFRIIKLEWVEKGGNWLLAELLLFFIPSAVGIVNYDEILSFQGAAAVLLIGFSTFIVMGATALTAEKIANRTGSESTR